jgi:hypothetical protein
MASVEQTPRASILVQLNERYWSRINTHENPTLKRCVTTTVTVKAYSVVNVCLLVSVYIHYALDVRIRLLVSVYIYYALSSSCNIYPRQT